jgi:predicted transcriptional regulator
MSTDRQHRIIPGIPVARRESPAPETIRLSLDVSPELYETLNSLAAKLHSTKSDVLRKAVALLEVAVRAKEEHKKFGVAAADQTLETEIVGL